MQNLIVLISKFVNECPYYYRSKSKDSFEIIESFKVEIRDTIPW